MPHLPAVRPAAAACSQAAQPCQHTASLVAARSLTQHTTNCCPPTCPPLAQLPYCPCPHLLPSWHRRQLSQLQEQGSSGPHAVPYIAPCAHGPHPVAPLAPQVFYCVDNHTMLKVISLMVSSTPTTATPPACPPGAAGSWRSHRGAAAPRLRTPATSCAPSSSWSVRAAAPPDGSPT